MHMARAQTFQEMRAFWWQSVFYRRANLLFVASGTLHITELQQRYNYCKRNSERATGRKGKGSIAVQARSFSLLQMVQTSSGAHPASNSVNTGALPGRNAAGVW